MMMGLTWTTVGEDAVEILGGRDRIETAIAALDWQDIPEDGALDVAFCPGHAINALIREFQIPGVRRVAITGLDGVTEREYHPGFYGIEAQYANGLARIFVVDDGVALHPVCSGLV